MQTLNIESDAVEEIPLNQIRLDEETQIRATINAETVQKYYDVMETEEGRNGFPPILLFRDDKGILWLADGHHRVLAAIRRKLTSIRAIIKNGSKREALWAAAKANRHNGLQMGKLDIRRAVKKILVFFPDRSNRVIAEAVGCSYEYVRKIRETTDNLLSVERTIGKDGKSRPARQQNKTLVPKNEVIATQKQAPPSSSAANDTSEKPTDTKEDQAKPESQLTDRQQKLRDIYPDMNLQEIIKDLKKVKSQGNYDATDEAEIASIWKDVEINQDYNCGVKFEPDPDDDYFDWISDEEREELYEMRKTCPNRLVPQIHNFTIQNIPEHKPDQLLACLFSLFKVRYREKLAYGLLRKMFNEDSPELAISIVSILFNEFQNK